MKKIYLIIVAIAVNFSLSAQQLSMYSQYYWNDFAINPAFTGFRNTPRVQVGYRNQWAGFQGAPKTYNIGGHTTFRKLNMGLGGMIFSDDQGGAIRQTGGMLNYSYQLKLGELSSLSMGVSGIINQYSFSGFNGTNIEPDAVLQTNVKQIVPDVNFGMAYNYKNKLFIGLAANQLFQSKIKNFNTINLTDKNKLIRHYYLTASYVAKVSSKVEAEPYLLLRTTALEVPQVELGSKFTYNNLFLGGLSYRNKESAIAMLGVNYKQFLFIYSYDILISQIRKYAGGSHELLLAYQFALKDKPKKVEPPKITDRDGDGILDNADLCPDEKGLGYTKGCPDRDNDSIKDSEDACPDLAGLKTFNGCPDSDNDGIKDSEDVCPNQKGLKEFGGCPDSDGDGLEDTKDACPSEKGLLALNGCPDKDADGIADKDDACPEVAGPDDNKGCPAKKKRNIDELMKKKLVCASGKADITEPSKLVVKEIAQVLKEEPTWTITIEGHTDNVGDANSNLMLSKKRSESVRNLLISSGIDASRIKAGYFGEKQPIADNKTVEGRNKNRRIDFKFMTD